MACDSALLDSTGQPGARPTLRLYAWSRPTVSIGRHQALPDAASSSRLERAGWGWVRRPTGGRAVFHGDAADELTYSVVAPLISPPFDAGWRAGYRVIHEALAAGLRTLGIDAEVTPASARRGSRPAGPESRRACFAASVPGEIVANGLKIVGSAQRRTREAILQHGSIPLAGDPLRINEIWPHALRAGDATTLSVAGARSVDPLRVAKTLVDAFARRLNVEMRPGALSRVEKDTLEHASDALAIA